MNIQGLHRSAQKVFHIVALALAASVGLPAAAQDASGPILFTNVNVFDGVNEALIENANVVVTGNKITAVSTEPLAIAGGTVIDGGGRTLMPGLTDCHWHSMAAYMQQMAGVPAMATIRQSGEELGAFHNQTAGHHRHDGGQIGEATGNCLDIFNARVLRRSERCRAESRGPGSASP